MVIFLVPITFFVLQGIDKVGNPPPWKVVLFHSSGEWSIFNNLTELLWIV